MGGNSRQRLKKWKQLYDAVKGGMSIREAAVAAGYSKPMYAEESLEKFTRMLERSPWVYDHIK